MSTRVVKIPHENCAHTMVAMTRCQECCIVGHSATGRWAQPVVIPLPMPASIDLRASIGLGSGAEGVPYVVSPPLWNRFRGRDLVGCVLHP
jgi:hypothetical protein